MVPTSKRTQWQPGQSGNPAGRPKKVLPDLATELKRLDLNPVERLHALLPKLSDRDQAKVLLELASYVYAKPKPSEHADGGDDTDGSKGPASDLPSEDLLRIVAAKAKEKSA